MGLVTEVIEYDELGNTKSETSWIYDNNGNLERNSSTSTATIFIISL